MKSATINPLRREGVADPRARHLLDLAPVEGIRIAAKRRPVLWVGVAVITSEATMFKIVSTCKGGGYMYCRTEPKHPRANSNGLYPLHRVLAENKIGRLLNRGEDVHHKDGNKSNNHPSNLEVLSGAEHTALHHPKLKPVKCVCECGESFEVRPHIYRQRMNRTKAGRLFCSMSCRNRLSK